MGSDDLPREGKKKSHARRRWPTATRPRRPPDRRWRGPMPPSPWSCLSTEGEELERSQRILDEHAKKRPNTVEGHGGRRPRLILRQKPQPRAAPPLPALRKAARGRPRRSTDTTEPFRTHQRSVATREREAGHSERSRDPCGAWRTLPAFG
jgi:hypothetical protein